MLTRRHAPTSPAVPVQDSPPLYQRASSPAQDLVPDSPNPDSSIPLSSLPRSDHSLVRSPDNSTGIARVHDNLNAYLPSTASDGGFEDEFAGPQSLESVYREHPERSFTGLGWPEHHQEWSNEEEPSVAHDRCPATHGLYPRSLHETFSERNANSFNSEELL
jgi:hypothetical protein